MEKIFGENNEGFSSMVNMDNIEFPFELVDKRFELGEIRQLFFEREIQESAERSFIQQIISQKNRKGQQINKHRKVLHCN